MAFQTTQGTVFFKCRPRAGIHVHIYVYFMTKEEDKRQISWRKSRGLNKENKIEKGKKGYLNNVQRFN